MFFTQMNLSLFEISMLAGCAIILVFAIRFFLASRKSMKKVLEAYNQKAEPVSRHLDMEPMALKMALPQKGPVRIADKPVANAPDEPLGRYNTPAEPLDESASPQPVAGLKNTLLKQKETLQHLLDKISELEESVHDRDELKRENGELHLRLEKLEAEAEQKDRELKQLKQQEAVSQQMAIRINEVYKEFELLQQKIVVLERQAGQTTVLELELEDALQSCDQLQKDLVRKQERLEEMIVENQRLHKCLSITEDKLTEANLQRQQLMKKVQFLQDMNNDMQHMSESNYKLQNELRRIGELESMLNLMSEERSRLAGKVKR